MLAGFSEGDLQFAPTYKLAVGSDEYKTGKRNPGWTDRVLYRAKDPARLQLQSYDSITDIRKSDHRPVLAEFLCDFELPGCAPPAHNASLGSGLIEQKKKEEKFLSQNRSTSCFIF